MKNLKKYTTVFSLLFTAILCLNACSVLKNKNETVASSVNENKIIYNTPGYDAAKKTVLVISDNDGTEMFDMMAPFYLFSATEKANVYIVAEKKRPIIVKRGLVVLPHFTFGEIDSLHIKADVMVVPNQSGNPKKNTVNFIKNNYTGTNKILSVCDGSATVAATGIYDGKELTTHSSDLEGLKKKYKKPAWVLGVSVTQNGNLFSTAGVANATEGSLTVISELFGRETMLTILNAIHYPHADIKKDHQNLLVQTDSIFQALHKGRIKKKEKIGVMLQSGINEFNLAAVLDTYFRSFPQSLETFSSNNLPVISKYGLTLLPTGDINKNLATEIHVLMPETFSSKDVALFTNAPIVQYENKGNQYIIDKCLKRITDLYGAGFAHLVKLMLDYN